MIWFTADTHFGHANIIKYTNRPFKDEMEMDGELVNRWNEVVEPDDVVYHLGDFTLRDTIAHISYLNGRIILLANWWHHDRRWLSRLTGDCPFDFKTWDSKRSASNHPIKTVPPLFVVTPRPSIAPPITLCHYPLAIWDRKHYGAWHLHGHSHGRYKGDGFIHDVGVDNNNFRPVSLDEIRVIMEKKGWHSEWRQYA